MKPSITIKKEKYKLPKHCLLRKAGRLAYTAAAALLFCLGVFLSLGVKWVLKTWHNLSMEELIYQLGAETAGVDKGLILDGISAVVPYTALGFLVFLLLAVTFAKQKKKALLIFNALAVVFGLILTGSAAKKAWSELSIGEYIAHMGETSTFVDINYVDPAEVTITSPENKRNLLFIFMESMEVTYANERNGGAFKKNYIPELTALAKEGECFAGSDKTKLNGAYVPTYSTWTMAGLYTQNTALPLKIPIDGNAMSSQKTFLPKVSALGDILAEDGYRQIYQCGSDATFAGRDLFFQTHGNYEIKDLLYAKEVGQLPEDYLVFWGYEDNKLYEFAKDYLTQAAAEDEPFNYTMLTVDTHFEDGYVCEYCENIYADNQYANVIRCSSKKTDAFISWVQAQSWYENTTVVMVGDHLTMDADFCEEVAADYERKIYVNILNAVVSCEDPLTRRTYCEEDIMPTVLASLGYTIEGDRLGLGTNLFSSTQTLSERFGISYVSTELEKNSKVLDEIASDVEEAQGE